MRYRILAIGVYVLLASMPHSAAAQTAVYQPLRSWIDPQQGAFAKWDAGLQERSIARESRPQVLGLRSVDAELLMDAMIRKHPRLLKNSPVLARELIVRRYNVAFPQLRGIMGEALFLEQNPEWGYVKKPNAPQHDVFRWVPGRRSPMTGQIKVLSGGPAAYAKAMKEDWRSERFFVPNDHVEAIRDFWAKEAARQTAPNERNSAYRQRARVKPAGFTKTQADVRTRNAARVCMREKYSTYTSLGAALALAAGPSIWDWANGNLPANQAVYRTARALSVLGVGVGTNLAMATIPQRAVRGTMRGNLIVGTAMVITETTWLLYEHGWSKALTTPDFYESVAGSATGLALGLAAGGATVIWMPGTGWVVGGAAVLSGAVAGTVGYIGGKSATHMIFEILAPEKLQQRQRERITEVNRELRRTIAELQKLAPL